MVVFSIVMLVSEEICLLNVSFLGVQNRFVPVFAGGYLCAHLWFLELGFICHSPGRKTP